MNVDPELQRDDDSPKGRSYSQRRGIRMDGNKRLPVLLGLALILLFVAGIIYFITKRMPSDGKPNHVRSHPESFPEKSGRWLESGPPPSLKSLHD